MRFFSYGLSYRSLFRPAASLLSLSALDCIAEFLWRPRSHALRARRQILDVDGSGGLSSIEFRLSIKDLVASSQWSALRFCS